ncbi:MAG: hypothetical protein P4L90_15255 [Rhodopila sp.]|nr:hypothetical protein [Rhodopila sp.]
MKMLIRAAFTALSLTFGIAHAATTTNHAPIQQGNNFNFMEGGGG